MSIVATVTVATAAVTAAETAAVQYPRIRLSVAAADLLLAGRCQRRCAAVRRNSMSNARANRRRAAHITKRTTAERYRRTGMRHLAVVGQRVQRVLLTAGADAAGSRMLLTYAKRCGRRQLLPAVHRQRRRGQQAASHQQQCRHSDVGMALRRLV